MLLTDPPDDNMTARALAVALTVRPEGASLRVPHSSLCGTGFHLARTREVALDNHLGLRENRACIFCSTVFNWCCKTSFSKIFYPLAR